MTANKFRSAFLLMALTLVGALPSLGATVYVDASVAGPGTGTMGDPYKVLYPTALSSAAPGDSVVVAPGAYPGTIHVLQDVILLGAGAGVSILDGGGTRALRIAGSVTAATLIDGFTITNGFGIEGGGVLWEKPATMRNCLIAGNVASSNGGGVAVLGGPAILDHCTIVDNQAAGGAGGGLARLGSSVTLTSCILWGNTPGQISGASVTVTSSDVQGGFAGVGNIALDPLFTNAAGGDYTLQCDPVQSPCIGTGDGGSDMGAFPACCGGSGAPVTVSGTVVSDCHGALVGVTVDLYDADGTFFTTSTDASGAYEFLGVAGPGCAGGMDGEVSVKIPLGYQADDPSGGEAAFPLTGDVVQDFALLCLEPSGEARSKGYWKHQASVYVTGRGQAQESYVDMTTNFPVAIFEHFHENLLNSIAVEGVTFMTGPAPLDLDTIEQTLKKKDSQADKAKQQYLALLLNLASGKILTSTVVSTDGATASQAIQYIADLLNDADPSNDELAKDIAEAINDATLVGSGVIPLGYDDIAYARPRFADAPLRVFPNPGSPSSGYVFSFAIPAAGEASLEIYDVAGRRVAVPMKGDVEAGQRQLRWDGRTLDGGRVGQGVYFARLTTAAGVKSVKLVHLAR